MYTGKRYGKHGKAGYDEFKELVEKNKMSLARDTPYYQDTWQYRRMVSVGTPDTKKPPRRCKNKRAKS